MVQWAAGGAGALKDALWGAQNIPGVSSVGISDWMVFEAQSQVSGISSRKVFFAGSAGEACEGEGACGWATEQRTSD